MKDDQTDEKSAGRADSRPNRISCSNRNISLRQPQKQSAQSHANHSHDDIGNSIGCDLRQFKTKRPADFQQSGY